jgi:hypothetical protein
MRPGWESASRRIFKYLGPNEAETARGGKELPGGYFLNDLMLVATLLNPAALTAASLSEANLQRGKCLLSQVYQKRASAPLPDQPAPGHVPRRTGQHGDGLGALVVGVASVRGGGDELAQYLAFDRTELWEERENFDLLAWWVAHQSVYPHLYVLALEYLVVPATSAAVERQFSSAKLIHAQRRQSLKTENLGELVFLSDHLDILDQLGAGSPRRQGQVQEPE